MKYLTPVFELEQIEKSTYSRVIGVDEVGRGCWAGPVCVGVYEFDGSQDVIEGVNDSKLLSANKRQETYLGLSEHMPRVFYGSVKDIDTNSLGGTLNKILLEIVKEYDDGKTLILLDGYFALDLGQNVRMLKKGDMNYYTIAAASIIAKVERDRLMDDLSIEYSKYGFENHKGYGTKEHRTALEENGICPVHRTSFKPIKSIINRFPIT